MGKEGKGSGGSLWPVVKNMVRYLKATSAVPPHESRLGEGWDRLEEVGDLAGARRALGTCV